MSDVDVEAETLIRERARARVPRLRLPRRGALPRRVGRARDSSSSWTRSTGRRTSSTAIRSTPSRSRAAFDGELVAGVVHNAATGEVFFARRGEGAFRDGAPIRVSTTTDPARALIGTGFPFRAVDVLERLRAPVLRRRARDVGDPPRRRRRARSRRRGLRALRRLLGTAALAVGLRRRRAARARGGRHRHRLSTAARSRSTRSSILAGNPALHRWLRDTIAQAGVPMTSTMEIRTS